MRSTCCSEGTWLAGGPDLSSQCSCIKLQAQGRCLHTHPLSKRLRAICVQPRTPQHFRQACCMLAQTSARSACQLHREVGMSQQPPHNSMPRAAGCQVALGTMQSQLLTWLGCAKNSAMARWAKGGPPPSFEGCPSSGLGIMGGVTNQGAGA